MRKYYSSNALYSHIETKDCPDFFWVSGNSWSLLYRDSNGYPKVVVFVSGNSSAKMDRVGRERMLRLRKLTHELAARAGSLFGTIEFDDNVERVSEVVLNGELTSVDGLKAWFADCSLPVQADGGALKAINDASSSAYHNWQRAALGRITVTDLDLIRIDLETGHIKILYELKRSYIELDKWTPFSAYYPNFNLLSIFAEMAKISFNIVYNVRYKSPNFYDDVSMLSIFSYSRREGSKRIAFISLDDFIERDQRS